MTLKFSEINFWQQVYIAYVNTPNRCSNVEERAVFAALTADLAVKDLRERMETQDPVGERL